MKINFLKIAQMELDDAIEYYNFEAPGLGDTFLAASLHQSPNSKPRRQAGTYC